MTPSNLPARPHRSRARLRAWLSIVVLTMVIVGVPAILFAVGGPPFRNVHYLVAGKAFTSAHRSDGLRLAMQWLTRGALLLAWISWAWVAVCVTLELRSWVTGHTPARLPASRTMQSAVACLVGTALAVSLMSRGLSAERIPSPDQAMTSLGQLQVLEGPIGLGARSLAAGPSLRADVGTIRPGSGDDEESFGRSPSFASGPDPLPGASASGKDLGRVEQDRRRQERPERPPREPDVSDPALYRVGPRDTLWSIAAERLGSARRWKELARLNYGTTQTDGGSLGHDHWVRSGWTLRLPAVEVADAGGVSAEVRTSGGPRHRGKSAGYVHRTDTVLLPVPGPAQASALIPVSGVSQSNEVLHTPVAPHTFRSPRAFYDPDSPATPRQPIVPIGVGVVGAGVANILDRMRRAQQRHRREGTYIPLPSPDQREIEQRLRAGDAQSIIQDVDLSLRLLAQWRRETSQRALQISGVLANAGSIAVVIENMNVSTELPAYVSLGEDERSLLLDRAELSGLVEGSHPSEWHTGAGWLGGGQRAPVPTLVSAGLGESGIVMVNLEDLGSLGIRGEQEASDAFIRALALELATSWWSNQFELLLVGFGTELERFERVNAVKDVAAVVRKLCIRRVRGSEQLKSFGFERFYEARSTTQSDEWDPIVVVCGPGTDQDDVASLVDATSDPKTGAAIVFCGDVGATHEVTLNGPHHGAWLSVLGSMILPQQIELEELASASSLLATAAQRESVLSSNEPYVRLPIPLPVAGSGWAANPSAAEGDSETEDSRHRRPSGTEASRTRTTDRADPAPGNGVVEVAVLGPIEIRGTAREFTRAWARELVVYLSMHPNGSSNESWATALWPDRVMAPSSLHSTASVARRALGQTQDGRDHLPRSHGRLQLSSSVTTDWDCFVRLADSPDTNQWRSALELIRGRPFEGLRSTDWPILEGIGPAIEAAVVDLSGRLAGTYLGANRPQDAQWAARKGLLVSPYDERLYRMLLRAADLAGHPAGVESVMAELIKLVADEVEPFDSIHPATVDLYRSLSRRRSLDSAERRGNDR